MGIIKVGDGPQAFPLCVCILQAIVDWRRERPGNEAIVKLHVHVLGWWLWHVILSLIRSMSPDHYEYQVRAHDSLLHRVGYSGLQWATV